MVWAKDPAHGAVVAIWTRGVCDDQGHRAYCDLIDREIDGASRYPKPVFVSIMDEGFEGPNAAQRKEAAELMDRVPENVIYVLVTRSKLLRGVSVAMRWLKPPRFHFEVVESLPDAITMLRDKHDVHYRGWERLEHEARSGA